MVEAQDSKNDDLHDRRDFESRMQDESEGGISTRVFRHKEKVIRSER